MKKSILALTLTASMILSACAGAAKTEETTVKAEAQETTTAQEGESPDAKASSAKESESAVAQASSTEKESESANSQTSSTAKESESANTQASSAKEGDKAAPETTTVQESKKAEGDPNLSPAPDFTFTDQFGKSHTLSDYKGKVVFLNFWATWCPPCRAEMPDIQALYEKYGENTGDVIVLGVAGPNYGNEKDIAGITKFLSENNYTYPTVMDETIESFMSYGISAYPTTFMINTDGNIFGYAQGAVSAEMMEDMISRTRENRRD